MRKLFMRIAFLLPVFLCWTVCLEAVEIDDILASRSEAESYTDQDAVELYKRVRYRLLPDGRCETQTQLVRLLQTYWACDHYGDPTIPYDSVRQDLTVSVSRTFMPGGKIVDTTPNGFNRVTPGAVGLAPDYVGLQEMVVTHFGLEPGAITYLDYTLRDREPLGETFSGMALFGGRNVTLRQEVVVEVPAGTSLQIKQANGAPAAQKSTSEGMDRYFWRMDRLPAAWAEDAEVHASRFRPRVSFSNAPDWDTALLPLINAIASGSELTPEIRDVIHEELADDLSPESRAVALHTYIHERFNFIDHAYPLFNRTIRPVAKVFESGYGHKLDLSVLYAALAKEAGLKAGVVLIFPNPVNVPNPKLSSEAWVIVQTDGGERFLDVTKPPGTCLRKELGDAYFIRHKEGVPLTPMPMPWMKQVAFSELFVTWNLKDDSSTSGKGVWRFSGALNYSGKMRGGDLEDFLAGMLGGFWKGIEIEDVRVRMMSERESELAFHLCLPQTSDTAAGIRTFRLPDGRTVHAAFLPKKIKLTESEREVPLFLRTAGEWRFKVRLEYPDEWKVVHLPYEVNVENAWGSFVQKVQAEDGAVTTERRVRLDARTIPKDAWGDFQRILQPGWDASAHAVVFE